MSFLIAVLTSSNSKKLDRCLRSIPVENFTTVVICNTQNPQYYTKANEVCIKHNVEMIITESNGNPGKGKNSLLEYFCSKDNYDYVIPIDGDDYFFPDGVTKIVNIIKENPEIDALGLTNSHVVTKKQKIYNVSYYEENFIAPPANTNLKHFLEFINHFNLQFGSEGTSIANFHRIILHSKRAAENCRYDNNLLGCEDMLYSLQLKKLDSEQKLNFKLKDCTQDKIHCYDVGSTSNGCSGSFLHSSNFEEKSKYLLTRALVLKNLSRHRISYI